MIVRYLEYIERDPVFDREKLSDALKHCANVEEYIKRELLNLEQEARGMTLRLASIVLRISIATIFLDIHNVEDPDQKKRVKYMHYGSSVAGLKITRHDCLDLHDKEIIVLEKLSMNYNILYNELDIIPLTQPISEQKEGNVKNQNEEKRKIMEIKEMLEKKIENDEILDKKQKARILSGFLTSAEQRELNVSPHDFISIFMCGDSFTIENDCNMRLLCEEEYLQTAFAKRVADRNNQRAKFKFCGHYFMPCCHKLILYCEKRDIFKDNKDYLCPKCKIDMNLFSIHILLGVDIKKICLEKNYCGACGKVFKQGLVKYKNCDHNKCHDCHRKFIPCNICN